MRSFRAVTRALFATSILGLAVAFVTSASAAVYSAHQALPSQTVQQFLSDPGSLLSQFPNGGPVMITKVRDLTASDSATLSALIGLLKSANPDQASAIGTAPWPGGLDGSQHRSSFRHGNTNPNRASGKRLGAGGVQRRCWRRH